MYSTVVLCVLSVVVVVLARPEQYTDKYDSTNVQEILDNDKILENYINCVLDLGKCTADAKELKSHIVDALENNCKDCTDIQREQVKKVASHLINKKKQYWEKLTAKYDPTKKYAAKYEKEVAELKE